jgi:hypothetical protein
MDSKDSSVDNIDGGPNVPPIELSAEEALEMVYYSDRFLEVMELALKARDFAHQASLPPLKRRPLKVNGVERTLADHEYKKHCMELRTTAGMILVSVFQKIMFETMGELAKKDQVTQDESGFIMRPE